MTNLDKICHKLMDSNHELKAKCALFEEENEELYEENKRLREILEYGKIDCKHLVSYEEGDYCMKTGDWFFDFEGYEDDCPTCKYCERR